METEEDEAFMRIIFTLVLIGSFLTGCKIDFSKKSEEIYEVFKVSKHEISSRFVASGRVTNAVDIQIKCKASGEVVELPFEVGDRVKPGDLLLRLDPVNEKRRVESASNSLIIVSNELKRLKLDQRLSIDQIKLDREQARTNLTTIRQQFEHARDKLKRQKSLHDKKLNSQENYDVAYTSYVRSDGELKQAELKLRLLDLQESRLEFKEFAIEKARSEIKIRQIALSDAQQRLDETSVYARSEGTVTSKNVQKGQIIASGISNVTGGTTVMVLSDLTELFVDVSLDESQVGKVSRGVEVKFQVESYPFDEFRGSVVRLSPKGIPNRGMSFFATKIKIESSGGRVIRPGMNASVEFLLGKKDGVLAIPYSAIFWEEGKPFVLVGKDPESAEKRFVELGLDGEMFEVKSGLKEDEEIIIISGEENNPWNRKEGKKKKGKG
jgi:HlyD family secretion protein